MSAWAHLACRDLWHSCTACIVILAGGTFRLFGIDPTVKHLHQSTKTRHEKVLNACGGLQMDLGQTMCPLVDFYNQSIGKCGRFQRGVFLNDIRNHS